MSTLKPQHDMTGGKTLPSGWRRVRIGNVVAEAKPGFACGTREASGVIQLRMNNVDTRGGLSWQEFIRVPADSATVSEYRLEDGDIVFNNTNSVELVGKTALFRGYPEPVVYSNHFTRLRVFPDRADPGFVAAWLLSQWQARTFENICNRWIGQSAVKSDKLLALEMPLPPLEEQKRIAAILNEQMGAVERTRAAAQAQLEAAKALPAAYLRAVFSSPEAQHWPRVPLGELAVLGPDNGVFKHRHEFGHGVPMVNVSDLYRSLAVDLATVERVQVTDSELQRFAISRGDLFFCRSSLKREGVGWCCYVRDVPEPSVFECHVMRVRLNPQKASPEFVAHYWAHPPVREEVVGNSRTATMTTMNQADLAGVCVPLPSLSAQQRIAAMLSEQMASADRARKAIEEELDAINKLPAALLRRAFNGEL